MDSADKNGPFHPCRVYKHNINRTYHISGINTNVFMGNLCPSSLQFFHKIIEKIKNLNYIFPLMDSENDRFSLKGIFYE